MNTSPERSTMRVPNQTKDSQVAEDTDIHEAEDQNDGEDSEGYLELEGRIFGGTESVGDLSSELTTAAGGFANFVNELGYLPELVEVHISIKVSNPEPENTELVEVISFTYGQSGENEVHTQLKTTPAEDPE